MAARGQAELKPSALTLAKKARHSSGVKTIILSCCGFMPSLTAIRPTGSCATSRHAPLPAHRELVLHTASENLVRYVKPESWKGRPSLGLVPGLSELARLWRMDASWVRCLLGLKRGAQTSKGGASIPPDARVEVDGRNGLEQEVRLCGWLGPRVATVSDAGSIEPTVSHCRAFSRQRYEQPQNAASNPPNPRAYPHYAAVIHHLPGGYPQWSPSGLHRADMLRLQLPSSSDLAWPCSLHPEDRALVAAD
jgi:hypothetical protein